MTPFLLKDQKNQALRLKKEVIEKISEKLTKEEKEGQEEEVHGGATDTKEGLQWRYFDEVKTSLSLFLNESQNCGYS